MFRCKLFLFSLVLSYCFLSFSAIHDVAASPTKEEVNLAKVPKRRFRDRRLAKIYRRLRRQYRMLYAHAAYDGFILPNERSELTFQRRIIHRILTIDTRNKKNDKKMRRFHRKKRLTKEQKAELEELEKTKKRYESMIQRFSCRYIRRYKKRYPKHCKRRVIKSVFDDD